MDKKQEKRDIGMLFSGLTREQYDGIKQDVYRDNMNVLAVYNLILIGSMVFVVIYSMLLDQMSQNMYAYVGALLVGCLLFILAKWGAPKNPKISLTLMYSFVAVMLLFGAILGLIGGKDLPTVSFIVFLLAVPIMFTDRPMRMNVVILISLIIYLVLDLLTKQGAAIEYDRLNIPIYGMVSLMVSSFLARIKLRKVYLEHVTAELSAKDQLTGLYNRRKYEAHMTRLREREELGDVVFMLFDINGLKTANDSLGHLAGDELIRAAADGIVKAYQSPESTYRIGGDEYVTILEDCDKEPAELVQRLNETLAAYKGTLIDRVEVACGIARSCDHPGKNIDLLVKIADESMYLDKARFYAEGAHNRRRDTMIGS